MENFFHCDIDRSTQTKNAKRYTCDSWAHSEFSFDFLTWIFSDLNERRGWKKKDELQGKKVHIKINHSLACDFATYTIDSISVWFF